MHVLYIHVGWLVSGDAIYVLYIHVGWLVSGDAICMYYIYMLAGESVC